MGARTLPGFLLGVAILLGLMASCASPSGPDASGASTTAVPPSVDGDTGTQAEESAAGGAPSDTSSPSAPAPSATEQELSTTTIVAVEEPVLTEVPADGTFENLVQFCEGPGFNDTVTALGGEFGFVISDVSPDFQLGSRPSVYDDRDFELEGSCRFDRFSIQFTTFALGVGSDLEAWERACQRIGGCLEYSLADDGLVWGNAPGQSVSLTFDDDVTASFRITFIMSTDGLDDASAEQVLLALVDRAPGPPYAAPVGFPCTPDPNGPPFCGS
ncbi:MAG: hypothetical protein AAF547_21380 [Actinomycetota bacterium]